MSDLGVGVFHVGFLGLGPGWAAWSGLHGGGRVGDAVDSRVHASCQGHASGRCRVIRRAEDATRAGTWISLRRTVAVVAFAISGAAVRVAAAWVRLNAMTPSTSQAALAVNFPEGRCASAERLRSAWTCSMIACPR